MDVSVGQRPEKLVWGVLGLALTAVVAYVLYVFVGAIVTGLFLYYATRPVRDWFDPRIDHRGVSAGIALLAVGVPMALTVAYGTFVGFRELNRLLATYQLSEYQAILEPYVSLPRPVRPAAVVGFLRDNANRILTYLTDLLVWLGRLFVAVVVAFYLLRDDAAIAGWFRRSLDGEHDVVRFLEGVDDDLDTVYTGNLLTVGITAVIAAATFYGFDLLAPGSPTIRFPFLLGLLVAVFTFVPVVGMKAIWVPYAGYLFARSVVWNELPVWVPLAFAVVAAVVVDFLPDVFVRSYLSKGSINMGLMLLAYALGVLVYGWYGIFLGPLVLVLFLHFARRVFPNLVRSGPFHLVGGEAER